MISLEEALHRNDPTLIGACRRLVERFNEGGIVPTLKAKRELDALLNR
ncbi:MAG: hypothetical protein VX796_09200 [Pseudomonadota bacterium]|nr:hypothetical protein [Pseudomonadota bacterium]